MVSQNMLLSEMLSHVQDARIIAGSEHIEVSGVVYDSRSVEPANIFVAMKGYHVDGHSYISDALKRGASVIVCDARYSDEETLAEYIQDSDATFVIVPNSRVALAPLAATWYGNPSHQLKVVGVTGTKGKTTTTILASFVLESAGFITGHISTLGFRVGSKEYPNIMRQTTPEATELQELLRHMVDEGCAYAMVEASSHGLSPEWNRLGNTAIDVAIFTNVTHEHLDYHGSVEQYRKDKTELFALLANSAKVKPDTPTYAIVNADDPYHQMFLDATPPSATCITYGITNEAQVRAYDVDASADGTHMRIVTPWGEQKMTFALPGMFNVYNALAALCAALSQQIPLEQACQALEQIHGLAGHMEFIDQGQPFGVLIDYAHNPDSFTQVFSMMRPLVQGRIIAVFGSAGERDVEKRPIQGAIAAQYCDIILLTDEDPRGEDRRAILEDIAEGIIQEGKEEGKDFWFVGDRAMAIRVAIRNAQPGDLVMLLGKGHEQTIEQLDGPHGWDEASEVSDALADIGYEDGLEMCGDEEEFAQQGEYAVWEDEEDELVAPIAMDDFAYDDDDDEDKVHEHDADQTYDRGDNDDKDDDDDNSK